MADSFKLKVDGVKELKAKFKKLDGDVQTVLAEAVSSAAALVEREAKRNSERGGDSFPHRITGNLINSIKELQYLEDPGRVESRVGSDMEYAPRLEYGFVGTDKKGRRYNQRPRPFLRPAFDDNADKMQKEFEAKLKQVLGRYK